MKVHFSGASHIHYTTEKGIICGIVKGRIKEQNCAFASDTAHFCDCKCAVSTSNQNNCHSIVCLHNVNHGYNTNTMSYFSTAVVVEHKKLGGGGGGVGPVHVQH